MRCGGRRRQQHARHLAIRARRAVISLVLAVHAHERAVQLPMHHALRDTYPPTECACACVDTADLDAGEAEVVCARGVQARLRHAEIPAKDGLTGSPNTPSDTCCTPLTLPVGHDLSADRPGSGGEGGRDGFGTAPGVRAGDQPTHTVLCMKHSSMDSLT